MSAGELAELVAATGVIGVLVFGGRRKGRAARIARELLMFAMAATLFDEGWRALRGWIDPRNPAALIVPMYGSAILLALAAHRVRPERWLGDLVRMGAWASCFAYGLAYGRSAPLALELATCIVFLATVALVAPETTVVRVVMGWSSGRGRQVALPDAENGA